uniref:Lipopolysaccharide heptosyltransferase 1 n=1 Tax=Thermodesulfobacterium geofontis TaxID=1295609 RepID=A0A7V5XH78_9BACT
MKILIVKLSALGDVVQTLPSLSLLRKFFPESKIDWVVDKRNAEILEKHPYINKILIFSNNIFFSFKKFKKFLRDLRLNEYDAVIDYQGLLKSGIITGLSKAKYKIGFANHREGSPFFYNLKLPPYDKNLHAVKRYLLLTKKVIEILGKTKDLSYFEEIPEPVFSLEILNRKLELIKKPYIVFVPSARWETKWWPFSHWENLIELCKDLAKNFDIFITGSMLEAKLKLWAENMEKKYPFVYSLVGKLSLKELMILIKDSNALVSVDTGPMHIASAFKKPVVALFGPTSSERTGPWAGNFKIIKSPLSCSPCFKKKCKDWKCMSEIKPEKVKDALEELLLKNYSL